MAAHKKKAMGRIPHSLSWLESGEHFEHNEQKQEQTEEQKQQAGAQEGLHAGWTRATFIIDKELHETVKAYAYWQRVTVKEVVDAALTQYFADKEVPPMPRAPQKTRNRLLD